MTRVVLDNETLSKLHRGEEFLEICDETGKLVGYLTPAEDMSVYENLVSPHSDEELARREQEEKTYSTTEMIQKLEKL